MRDKFLIAVLAGMFVFGLFSQVQAAKPRDDNGDFLGNGFPSGTHYNLNIKAKDPNTFTCPAEPDYKYYCPANNKAYGSSEECSYAENCGDTACIEVLGNVINFPYGDGGTDYTILMESGSEKPKGKPTTQGYPDLLEVTDWCMGFTNNDDTAAFRLPADPDGYAVYARLTGDPKEDPVFDFTSPEFAYVEDSNQDLIMLGYIQNGVFNPAGEDIGTVSREKGKGVSKATEITPLFMWSGDVCTFIDWGAGGVPTDQCCIDAEPPATDTTPAGDGIYEDCTDPSGLDQCCNEVECYTPELLTDCEEGYVFTEVVCDGDYVPEVVYCISYVEPTWVFNIAEFVGMLFNIDPDGDYKASLIQIRFYPLPLDIDAQ